MQFPRERAHRVTERRFLATRRAHLVRRTGGIADGLCFDVDVLGVDLACDIVVDVGGRGVVGGSVQEGALELEAAAVTEVEDVARAAEFGAVDEDFAVGASAGAEVLEGVGKLDVGGPGVRGWREGFRWGDYSGWAVSACVKAVTGVSIGGMGYPIVVAVAGKRALIVLALGRSERRRRRYGRSR